MKAKTLFNAGLYGLVGTLLLAVLLMQGCASVIDYITDTTVTYRQAQDRFDYWNTLLNEVCSEPTSDMQSKCEKYRVRLDKIQEDILDPWAMAIEMADISQEDYEQQFAVIKRKASIIILKELMKD